MFKFLFCFSLIFFSPLLKASEIKLKQSEVSFIVEGNPGFIEIEGKGANLYDTHIELNKGIVKGTAYVKLIEFTTGMDTRDEHMRSKYLDVKKYPKAKLEFEGLAHKFKGFLTIKKERAPVEGEYSLKEGVLKASFVINMRDYPSIGVPSWLGITVANIVYIKVQGKY